MSYFNEDNVTEQMCIAVAKEAGYEYCGADELREAKNDVIVEPRRPIDWSAGLLVYLAEMLVFEYEALAGLEVEVLREVEVTACEHVLGLGGAADDLGIALHFEGGGL